MEINTTSFLSDPIQLFLVAVLLTGGTIASILARKLTRAAAITGWLLGLTICAGAGYKGLAMLVTFFVLGTVATAWKKEQKRGLVPGEEESGQRKTGQVIANAGVPALLALLAIADTIHAGIYLLMMAGSFAAAMADTLSSELGMVYGQRFYNVISWKKEQKGLDGVVSIEGTLIGIAGAAVIAILYVLPTVANRYGWMIIAAGALGNLADSVLGALWERKKYIGNDTVNFLNTFVAALATWLLWYLCS